MINNQVRLFKNFSAEFGDPSNLFWMVKFVNPPLVGIRIIIRIIKKRLSINQKIRMQTSVKRCLMHIQSDISWTKKCPHAEIIKEATSMYTELLKNTLSFGHLISSVRFSIERVLSCPNFIFMHLSQQRHCAYLGKRNYWDSESPVSARTLPASQELHQDSDRGGEAKEASNPVLT